jgi:hypothetical protein
MACVVGAFWKKLGTCVRSFGFVKVRVGGAGAANTFGNREGGAVPHARTPDIAHDLRAARQRCEDQRRPGRRSRLPSCRLQGLSWLVQCVSCQYRHKGHNADIRIAASIAVLLVEVLEPTLQSGILRTIPGKASRGSSRRYRPFAITRCRLIELPVSTQAV